MLSSGTLCPVATGLLPALPACRAGEKEYYLASAFGEIYAPPSASLSLRGMSVAGTFLRGALEKVGGQHLAVEAGAPLSGALYGLMHGLAGRNCPFMRPRTCNHPPNPALPLLLLQRQVGVEPEVRRIGKYKSAGDQLLREDMSEAQREQLVSVVAYVLGWWLCEAGLVGSWAGAHVAAQQGWMRALVGRLLPASLHLSHPPCPTLPLPSLNQTALLDDMYETWVTDVAASLGKTREEVRPGPLHHCHSCVEPCPAAADGVPGQAACRPPIQPLAPAPSHICRCAASPPPPFNLPPPL